jgi:cyclopropane fatty-acyl-phospholipid synthase-like methyltransferase
MSQEPAWYESFFGQDYLDVYGYQFTEERARKETTFAAKALELKAGERVLDLCCGQGRHAVILAEMGMQVTGLDLSEHYLQLTEAAAQERGVEVATVKADMRAIPSDSPFDAIVNMFSSFGYLESEEEDAKVMTSVFGALKPGGRVLFDLLNRDWVVSNYIQNDWHSDAGGTLYLEHRELDLLTSRNHVTFTAVSSDGTRRELGGHHIRLYTLREAAGMLEAAGLSFEAVYGGFDDEAYGIGTRRMIIAARRPG